MKNVNNKALQTKILNLFKTDFIMSIGFLIPIYAENQLNINVLDIIDQCNILVDNNILRLRKCKGFSYEMVDV